MMHKNREEILKILEENRNTLRNYGVRRLGLFGSQARGETTSDSDLDFIVEFETKTFDGYMDLKAFLGKLFNHKVDLVLVDTIKRRLRPSILKEAVYAQGL